MASDDLAAIDAELARRESLAAIDAELSKRATAPTSEIRSATPTSWGIADPIRKGLYNLTGSEMFDDMKGVPIQENYDNGSLEGYSYGGKLRNALATGTEVAGNVAGGLGAGLLPGVGWLGIGTGATAGDLAARGLNRSLGLRPLEDPNTGEKEGLTDPYTSLNPLENPLVLNLLVPGAASARKSIAGSAAKAADKMENRFLGVRAKNLAPDKYDVPQITEETLKELKNDGILQGVKSPDQAYNNLKNLQKGRNKDVEDVLQEVEQSRLESGRELLPLDYDNAKKYIVDKKSIGKRQELLDYLEQKKLADTNPDFEKNLNESLLNRQREKVNLYRDAYSKDINNKPDVDTAMARDLRELVEAQAAAEGYSNVGELNRKLGQALELDPILKEASKNNFARSDKTSFNPYTLLKRYKDDPVWTLRVSRLLRALSGTPDPTELSQMYTNVPYNPFTLPTLRNKEIMPERISAINPAILRALIASAQNSNDNEGQ